MMSGQHHSWDEIAQGAGRKNAELAVSEHEDGLVGREVELLSRFQGGGQGFHEHRLHVGNALGHHMRMTNRSAPSREAGRATCSRSPRCQCPVWGSSTEQAKTGA